MRYEKTDQLRPQGKSHSALTRAASRDIKQEVVKGQKQHCEFCGRGWALYPAHRHKRVWYRNREKLLASPSQWVLLCTECHQFIENNKHRTELLFKVLRPDKTVSFHEVVGFLEQELKNNPPLFIDDITGYSDKGLEERDSILRTIQIIKERYEQKV